MMRTGSPAEMSTRPPIVMSNASPASAPFAVSVAIASASAKVAISVFDRSWAMISRSSHVA
jgi:hypothetical protein